MEELSLTETESRYYSDLFLCCDVEKTGKIPLLKATEFFRSSNISNDIVRQIFSLTGISQTALHISRSQFYSCLKLIAACQASVPLRLEIISSSINLPLPRFSWKESSPKHTNRHSITTTITPTTTTTIVTSHTASGNNVIGDGSNIISSGARAGVGPSSLSLSVTETNGPKISSGSATLPAEARLWREIRTPDLIELSRSTSDIQQDPTNSDLQSTDSEVEHNESSSGRVNRRHRGGSPEAWSTNSDSPTPTNSVAERPWAKDNLWQGLLGDEHRQLLGTEEESSDRHSSDDDNETDLESLYQITPEQREYYYKQFKAVQPDPKGLLSGHIARLFFEKSRIPVEELRHIWQLCDVTRDGALSLAEFTAAMHLVVLRRNNIPLPPILPPCLHPSVLNQATQPAEPPEADLLHLGDDDKTDAASAPNNVTKENEYKRMISVHTDKNVMNISTLSTNSQTSTSSRKHGKNSSSPPTITHKTRSVSNSPPAAEPSSPPPTLKTKELVKDWTNQNKEWTKFTESPTSNVSSPGPKPVNFDMQRTAQAVVSDPQILHPVPLRVTPVGAEATEDELNRLHRKTTESLVYDNSTGILRDNDISPKQQPQYTQHVQQSQQHRDSLQNNDLRAIQRPQPKKLPTKSIGAIPPPPQREPSVGSNSGSVVGVGVGDTSDSGTIIVGLGSKKDPPPLPPPRPHRHARSSSLDLNKLKMGGAPSQPEMIAQNSLDVQMDSNNSGFADFTHFPEGNQMTTDQSASSHVTNDTNIPPPPRPTISSLQTNQRVSAFEVYRKPNTPRSSQSPDSSQHLQQPPLPSTNSSSTVSIPSSGLEYEKRVSTISDNLRHVSFKYDKNILEVLRHLREQNVLLLRLCNDLSEELLTVQQKKEEVRSKLEIASTVGSGNISTNVTGGSGSSGVHSNV